LSSGYDWEMEQAVLGGLLLGDPQTMQELGGLQEEDFFKPAHQHLFGLILQQHARSEPHDLPLILSLIRSHPKGPDWFGGISYVAALPTFCPSLEAISGYSRRLRSLSHRRRIQHFARELSSFSGDEDELQAQAITLGHLLATPAGPALDWRRGLPPREPPTPDWLLMEPAEPYALGIFPVGKVGLLAAPGGIGKSSALAWLALSVATGRPWFGLSIPRPGRVALILGEETAVDVDRKLFFGARALKLTAEEREQVNKNVLSMGTAGKNVTLLRTDRAGNLYPSPFAEHLFGGLSQEGPFRAILLDPLSRFSHAETEVDAAAATRTVEALERLTTLPGNPAVLVAHQSRKSGKNEGHTGMTGDDIRGSSALRDGVRWAAVLDLLESRPSEKTPMIRLSVVKSNVGRIPTPALAVRESGGALRDASAAEQKSIEKQNSPIKITKRSDVKNDD